MKNIKIAMCIGLLALLTNNIQAQVKSFAGFTTGINYGSFKFEKNEDTDATTYIKGLFLSGFAEVQINGRLSIQGELTFIQKGFKIEVENVAAIRTKLNYFEIPLLLKYDFVKEDELDLVLYAGPSFGFLRNQKDSYQIDDHWKTLDEPVFPKSEYNSTETGIAFGIAVRAKAGAGKFIFDVRSNTAVGPVIKSVDNGNIRNTGIVLAVGYAFPLN
jgi:hypothetical protein